MADVFISYTRDNQELVRRLSQAVKDQGYSVWWDDELPPHRAYGEVITEQIGEAKAAIVVWSHGAAASEWVRAEADVARNQKKLIQVSIDDRMPPLPFNQLHFVSIRDWQGEADHPGWMKVKESLTVLCGRPEDDRGLQRTPWRPPPRPAASPVESAPPGRSNATQMWLIGVIAASLLVIALVGVLAVMGGRDPVSRAAAPGSLPAESAPPPPAAPMPRQPPTPLETDRADEASAPAPEIRLAAGPPEILPESSVRRLTPSDVASLSPAELRIARNEIFARRGRIFRDPRLRRHFSRYPWYQPVAADVPLSALERANVRLLQEAESW